MWKAYAFFFTLIVVAITKVAVEGATYAALALSLR